MAKRKILSRDALILKFWLILLSQEYLSITTQYIHDFEMYASLITANQQYGINI